MENALVVCTVAGFLNFELNDIKIMHEMGYQVHIATNFKGREAMYEKLLPFHTENYQIDFARNPFSTQTITAYMQLKRVIQSQKYNLIHCHTPVGGALTRLIARSYRKTGTKVMYTAHGFHFYKGAPLKNWLIYYPIERWLSKYTDVLITINTEDYDRAKKKFYTKHTKYIYGVGVNVERFANCTKTKEEKRQELGISQAAFVLLSVGELSERKNQKVVIEALGEIKDASIYYIIAGEGRQFDAYLKRAEELGIESQLMLLGRRDDIDELCIAADVFVHPSIREGLGIAPLEGMASGLPLISTYINGMKDYTEDGVTGYCIKNPEDVGAMKRAIMDMKVNTSFRESCAENNRKIAAKYDIVNSEKEMRKIYGDVTGGLI